MLRTVSSHMHRLWRAAICVVLVCVFSNTATGWATETSEQHERSGDATVGATAPWFALWSSEGAVINRTSLADETRAGTAIVFFATWCQPCIAGMNRLRSRQRDLDAAGVRVLLISVDDSSNAVEAWLTERGYDWPWVHDRFRTAAAAFGVLDADAAGVLRLPFTATIDRDEAVRALIGTEGADYVDLILSSLTR